ncbi:hypothetical protein M153_4580005942 [Pseudoloma neurophilia]|uniref:Uncharacterized protein n=1 Tax=Pseudoloma neurophilia TaxID=146866 RepID=A0A0R0LXN7_9MICR|nr:hypothetical protein M153_4580005942 [Pseudoloma neurophilia]
MAIKKKRFYPAQQKKEIQTNKKGRISHLYKKVVNYKKHNSDFNTLFLWGKLTSQKFVNPFFSFPVTDLLSNIELSNDPMKNKNTSPDFIIQLKDKQPSLPSIKKDSELIYSEGVQVLRYNLVTKQKTVYTPSIGELGEIITDQTRIRDILEQEDEKYVRIKRVTLDDSTSYGSYNEEDGSTEKKIVQNTIKNSVTNTIKKLQLVVDGWFKGYSELGIPIKGIFTWTVVFKKVDQKNEKLKIYRLSYKNLTGSLKTNLDFNLNDQVTAKIKNFENGSYHLEIKETVDMSIGW